MQGKGIEWLKEMDGSPWARRSLEIDEEHSPQRATRQRHVEHLRLAGYPEDARLLENCPDYGPPVSQPATATPALPPGILSAADTEREMDRVEALPISQQKKAEEFDRLDLTRSWEYHMRKGES